ncbi:MAG: hypothetical protein QOD63_81 [Actinomycetota bacterium]|jgi:hypothetical protein|nr:hypothetical protein [Actinomycetota bacterium]
MAVVPAEPEYLPGSVIYPGPHRSSPFAEREVHGPRCSANPEVGCVCGYADAGEDRPYDWASARDLSVTDGEAAAFAAEMRGA